MSETATTEAVNALRTRIEAIADEVDAEATETAIRWAREDLERQGVDAVIIPLPDTAPKMDDLFDENWNSGPIIPTAHSPKTVALWSCDDIPGEDHPEMVITYEAAAALLPQLARLVADHEAEQTAARERRIKEYAAALHASSDVCALYRKDEVCESCTRAATYVIDNPPPAA